MNLLRKITWSKKVFIYSFFIVLHLFLLNINVAEWGDTYRILRASEFVRKGSYPVDEKRPPLFSTILAVRPLNVDQVAWGRGVMFAVSILTFIVFDKLVLLIFENKKYRNISLLFFALNPVLLYWSLRVYADMLFTLFVLLTFYLLTKWQKSLDIQKCVVLGFLAGLSILTRFEGYILFISILVGVLYAGREFKPKLSGVFRHLKLSAKFLIPLGLTTLITVLPYLAFCNPLTSRYFSETSRRVYDLKMVWSFIVSFLYLFGFAYAFYFVVVGISTVIDFLKKHAGILTFLVLELMLILLWPAAIPRLFVPIVPFLIILFLLSFEGFTRQRKGVGFKDLGILGFLLGFYVSSQYFLRLQFLVLKIPVFVLLILLQLLLVFFIYKKKLFAFLYLALVSSFIWAFSTIYLHKNIYTAIKSASIYIRENIKGTVAFNDVTSTADWYLNYANPTYDVEGIFYAMSSDDSISYQSLLDHGVDYLLVTNEDSISVSPEIERKSYLKPVKEFRYNIGERLFFAKILKFSGGVK